jgi:diguanylate cyclase (GGDEF)-like protein
MGEAAENLGETAAAVLEAFKGFEHFCKCLLDAYAVVDMSGKVHKCNPLFAQLVGLRTKQILKADSFDDILELSVAGKPLKVADTLAHTGPTRIDEVSGTSSERQDLNLIIGVYPFAANGQPLGAFLLLRDVTAETNLQDKYKDKATASITDALTGLFNRAYFTEYLASQMATLESFPATAAQRVVSVVMLDIDFFKKINDGYSHQAGDFVLKHTSELMKKCFRKTDIVARYGGEEFLAILPGTDAVGACIAAEKLRMAVQAYKFEFEGRVIPVTISSGVAQINIGKETGEQAIARADAALYFSKESGRNRVSIHDGAGPKASDAKPTPAAGS